MPLGGLRGGGRREVEASTMIASKASENST